MRLPARIRRDKRTGIYHFRVIVPAALRAEVGKREQWRLLATKDPGTAKLLAYWLNLEHLGEQMSKPDLDELLRQAASGGLRSLETRFADGTVFSSNRPSEFDALQKMSFDYRSRFGVSVVPARPAVAPTAPTSPNLPSEPFWPAAEGWLSTITTAPAKTLGIKRTALRDFQAYLESLHQPMGLAEITPTVCYDYVLDMSRRKLNVATQVNKMTYLAQFFDAMMKARKYPDSQNPARGHVKLRKKDRKRAAKANGATEFSKADLEKIFNPATYPRDSPHSFWAPLICLFTGCRVSEVCQTRVEDFHEVDGLLCMLITGSGKRQSVKNDASERLVPLHPKLRQMGLEAYLADVKRVGETYLFGYLGAEMNGMGDAASKKFNRYVDELEIKAEVGRKTMHSFRDTVANQLKVKGVPPDKRHQFVGHADDTIESIAYTSEFVQSSLAEVIHPALTWSFPMPAPYMSGEFFSYLVHNFAKAEKQKRHDVSSAERNIRNGRPA